MNGVDVRRAHSADVSPLAQLGSAVFIATYGATADLHDLDPHVDRHFSEAAVARALSQDGVDYLLAEDGGVCCGFLKLVAGPLPELVPADSALEVQQLYVATARQRGGVGGQLMDAAVERARVHGVAGLWLSVWTEADWATRFYEAYGFRAQGLVPFQIGSTTYEDFLMWLAVGGG